MNENLIDKLKKIISLNGGKRMLKKKSTKYFLISKNKISQSVHIFNRYAKPVVNYTIIIKHMKGNFFCNSDFLFVTFAVC